MSKVASPARHLPLMSVADNDDGDSRLFRVGDIAKLSGKTVRAIHLYEELGLLRPHARSKARYRLYDSAALTRVRWIGKLHDLGLSLGQIQHMVKTWEESPSAPDAMAKVRRVYSEKLEDTRTQIANLLALETELVASIDYFNTCNTCDPAEIIAACARCHHHDDIEDQPELIAGIHSTSTVR